MDKIQGKESPDNGTGQSTPPPSPVSDNSIGSVLDDHGLAAFLQSNILNDAEEQEKNAPAPTGETAPVEPEAPASADSAASSATDTTDLSQTESAKDEDEEQPDPTLSEGIKRRFAKLTAKRREAEDKLQSAVAEIEKLRSDVEQMKGAAPAPVPDAANPFTHLERQEDIDREIAQARSVRRWCEANPDGAVVKNGKNEEVEYTAEQIRHIKLNAIDAIEQHLPERLNYIRESTKYHAAAEQIFPWWKDRSSKQRQEAEQLLAQAPELKRFPNYRLFLGDYLLGVAYRQQQAAKKQAPPKKAPAQPGKPLATPVADETKSAALQAKNSFAKTKSDRDLTQVVLNNFL